jgi:hypothetical protein
MKREYSDKQLKHDLVKDKREKKKLEKRKRKAERKC